MVKARREEVTTDERQTTLDAWIDEQAEPPVLVPATETGAWAEPEHDTIPPEVPYPPSGELEGGSVDVYLEIALDAVGRIHGISGERKEWLDCYTSLDVINGLLTLKARWTRAEQKVRRNARRKTKVLQAKAARKAV